MNKEIFRKSIGESTGIYIGREFKSEAILFCDMKKQDIPNDNMQVGLLGEGKRIIVGDPKGEKNHIW